MEGGAPLQVGLALPPVDLLTAPDAGEGAGNLGIGADQVAVTVLLELLELVVVQEVPALRTGGTLRHSGLQAGSEVAGGEVGLAVRQGAHLPAVGTLHSELEDLSVSDAVREDVRQGDVGVVVGAGLALTEPADQAGLAEPVAAHCLLGVSLDQQTDRTLKPGRVVNKGVVVTSLVVMLS